MLEPAHAADLPGKPLQDATGEVVGEIEEVFVLPSDGTPSWARVNVGDRTVVVPLAGATVTPSAAVRAGFDRDAILEAPGPAGLDAAARDALHAHYGISDADLRDDSGFAPGRPARPATTAPGDGMVPGHP